MAITSLEMEKVRRQIERNNLIVRMNSIDERLKAIDEEKTMLLQRLARENTEKPVKGSIRASSAARNLSPVDRTRGFHYQY